MSTSTLPDAAPHTMACLAELLAERGVELRVAAGVLQYRDGRSTLDEADRRVIHHYRDALADWLDAQDDADATEHHATEHDDDGRVEHQQVHHANQPPHNPTPPTCDRCGRPEFIEVAIHAGRSIRRDCAACGRTWGFPVWHGEPDANRPQ